MWWICVAWVSLVTLLWGKVRVTSRVCLALTLINTAESLQLLLGTPRGWHMCAHHMALSATMWPCTQLPPATVHCSDVCVGVWQTHPHWGHWHLQAALAMLQSHKMYPLLLQLLALTPPLSLSCPPNVMPPSPSSAHTGARWPQCKLFFLDSILLQSQPQPDGTITLSCALLWPIQTLPSGLPDSHNLSLTCSYSVSSLGPSWGGLEQKCSDFEESVEFMNFPFWYGSITLNQASLYARLYIPKMLLSQKEDHLPGMSRHVWIHEEHGVNPSRDSTHISMSLIPPQCLCLLPRSCPKSGFSRKCTFLFWPCIMPERQLHLNSHSHSCLMPVSHHILWGIISAFHSHCQESAVIQILNTKRSSR